MIEILHEDGLCQAKNFTECKNNSNRFLDDILGWVGEISLPFEVVEVTGVLSADMGKWS